MPGAERSQGASTAASKEVSANIEKYFGVSLKDVEPETLRIAIERSKQLGNDAFNRKRYPEAIQMYTQAIAGDQTDRALYTNRSAAYLASGLFEQALWDAEKAIALAPSWSKAYYRLGCAYAALNQWPKAVAALKKGIELEPDSAELSTRLREAQKRVAQTDAARQAAAATERRSLLLKLRAARREDQRLAMLNQFKQSMTAPDWEPEDLEWRPTWLTSLRLTPLSTDAILSDQKRTTLLGFLSNLADLAHPKAALRTLADQDRLLAYQGGLEKALEGKKGAHTLSLSSGGGVLSLLAARAGAGRVTAVERSRMLYRMAKQVLGENESAPGASSVHLVAKSLFGLRVADSEEDKPTSAADIEVVEASASAAAAVGREEDALPARAELLVTDLIDHSVLGMGLLPAVDYAAEHLLTPTAVVLPSRVRVRAMLVDLSLGPISGFDLSPLDSYRWFPGDERVDLARDPPKPLSRPFLAHAIDLQARVAAVQKKSSSGGGNKEEEGGAKLSSWEADFEVEVEVTTSGRWNAVAFWFELEMEPTAAAEGGDDEAPPAAISSGMWPLEPSSAAVGRSWGQAVQYLDARQVEAGSVITLRVRQDKGQIVFTPHPPPCRLHHALAPRWHYDMVTDHQRNAAYDTAIRSAVARRRDALGSSHLSVLDIGAGTGLLSMMAARAGADEGFAAEISAHMCDAAEEVTMMNGFLGKILVLDRDVRRMDTVLKPDGTPPELPHRANLAVFEIFDSGLIGEGVLHCLTAAKAKLLTMDAALVPASAVVYAQPIQMRVSTAAGMSVEQANRWRWRPDYEGVELTRCREDWTPLAPPLEVFSFEFYEVERSMRPEEARLDFKIDTEGVFNAVAMWFELHLDEETTLSTSPYAEKGPTWQQAVQWLPEVRVKEGNMLGVIARHDTYSISYDLSEEFAEGSKTGVPVVDTLWKAAFDALQGVNSQLVKACVQNPLEYRAVAHAAVQFAARPHDLGLDAATAAEFCGKMMG